MYKFKIILRYLRARHITVIPILAVMIAVFLLIVVPSVMNGFSNFIESRMRGTTSDIIVEYDDMRGFENYVDLANRLRAIPKVQAVAPHLSGKAVLTFYVNDRAGDFACEFIGVDPIEENRAVNLDDFIRHQSSTNDAITNAKSQTNWTTGAKSEPGLLSGIDVLPGRNREHDREHIKLLTDRTARLTTPTSTDEDNSLLFDVTRVFETELYEYDRTTVYIGLDQAQKLLRLEGRANSLHVRAVRGADLDKLKAAVCAALEGDELFVVKTWQESQQVMINAMKLERMIWVVIMSALLAVAGFCILAVMTLTVLQNRQDIGIMRSLGASRKGILGTFIQYGLAVGLIGSTAGLIGAALVLEYLDSIEWLSIKLFDWTPWDRSVFVLRTIPREFSWSALMWVWLGGVLISLASSLIPAARAAWTNPVRTLRCEL